MYCPYVLPVLAARREVDLTVRCDYPPEVLVLQRGVCAGVCARGLFDPSSGDELLTLELSGVTNARIPGANSPPGKSKPMLPMYALPRPSTAMSFQGWSERLLKSVWVTSDPSGSRRSRSRSCAETISRRPSGSQSMQNGNDGMRTMTSLLPWRSTAMSSCAPQSENQRRSSCQRGDSPNMMPAIRVCSSVTYLLLSSGTRVGLDGTVLMFEMSASIKLIPPTSRSCLLAPAVTSLLYSGTVSQALRKPLRSRALSGFPTSSAASRKCYCASGRS